MRRMEFCALQFTPAGCRLTWAPERWVLGPWEQRLGEVEGHWLQAFRAEPFPCEWGLVPQDRTVRIPEGLMGDSAMWGLGPLL